MLILYCYMVIETILIVYYNISLFSYIIMSAPFKLWPWLHLGHTQVRMSSHPEHPCYKVLEIINLGIMTETVKER